ncbi:MAG: hypothetical protein QX199_10605 [Methylococcaceae bacterium]
MGFEFDHEAAEGIAQSTTCTDEDSELILEEGVSSEGNSCSEGSALDVDFCADMGDINEQVCATIRTEECSGSPIEMNWARIGGLPQGVRAPHPFSEK